MDKHAKELGCEKTAINDILKRLHEPQSLTPKNNPDVHRFLIHQLIWTARTEQPISVITIRCNLKKIRLTACIPRKKLALSEAHRQAHLEWAHAHENWREGNGDMLFSDA
uniref:Transposase Tc1-like domain-containing protein n=1 Tax=Rhizophagus irregularis (strain DAOM 181602 / DAOM 197198 / MUCL 43194) TaxID=747089 RepID=U9T5E7_RHIID